MLENREITEYEAVVHGQMAVAQLAMKFCAFYKIHKFAVMIRNDPSLCKCSAANFLVLPFSLLISDNRLTGNFLYLVASGKFDGVLKYFVVKIWRLFIKLCPYSATACLNFVLNYVLNLQQLV